MVGVDQTVNRERLAKFVEWHARGTAHDLLLRTKPLRGGLVSESVLHVSARFRDPSGKPKATNFVVKRLDAESAREAAIYHALSSSAAARLAPELLGVEHEHGAHEADPRLALYLEAIVAGKRWPWGDVSHAARVLEGLAELHEPGACTALERSVTDWDYEAELQERALLALDEAKRFAKETSDREMRGSVCALQRLVDVLPEARKRLMTEGPLPSTVLHGDVHPGNVLVRKRRGRDEPVLLDWGRARIGSPLEDVSSWLQSLGFWEPEVKRKHDSLLGAYLAARGLPSQPSRELRDAYWLAAASNYLAGALRYHLEVAASPDFSESRRASALAAARDCLRVVRRADACVRR